MCDTDNLSGTIIHFPQPSLDDQANLVEKFGADTLLFCPNAWAMRHFFVNQDTGEVARARCNRWDCLFCGPRKVDTWRQLVKAAQPTLFLTLTKAGHTVEEAARALTTFLQHLRRGSKGRGPSDIGARPAYLIEYFAVLERHENFEENGFHWHLLIKGVDFIPHDILKEAWRSARHGIAYIVHIESIRKPHVIGYVTKYLTKSLSSSEKGVRSEKRETVGVQLDDDGQVVETRQTYTAEIVSKARRTATRGISSPKAWRRCGRGCSQKWKRPRKSRTVKLALWWVRMRVRPRGVSQRKNQSPNRRNTQKSVSQQGRSVRQQSSGRPGC